MVRENTPYIGLIKPDSSDQYNIKDFNDNADTIDSRVKLIEDNALTKANKDLSNLSSDGQTILDNKLNMSQVTNCILEAPNGVLTWSGSTITIKNGLKYLSANGRNSNLTLKNAKHVLAEDQSVTFTGVRNNLAYIYIINGVASWCPVSETYFVDNDPVVFTPTARTDDSQIWFDLWNNNIYFSEYGSSNWVKVTDLIIVGKLYADGQTIKTIRMMLPANILKIEDKSYITSWNKSSDYHLDIAIGTTGQIYYAPANGKFNVGMQVGTGTFMRLYNSFSKEVIEHSGGESLSYPVISMNVQKGDAVTLTYNYTGEKFMRFIQDIGDAL